MNDDRCQRCGNGPDPDLRTLWMACFYEMNEIGIPFAEIAIDGVPQRCARYETVDFLGHGFRQPIFEPVPDAKPSQYKFFTLRVCKDCRSDWMRAIQAWFETKPVENEGPGLYVRDLGTSRRVSLDEFNERRRRGEQ